MSCVQGWWVGYYVSCIQGEGVDHHITYLVSRDGGMGYYMSCIQREGVVHHRSCVQEGLVGAKCQTLKYFCHFYFIHLLKAINYEHTICFSWKVQNLFDLLDVYHERNVLYAHKGKSCIYFSLNL